MSRSRMGKSSVAVLAVLILVLGIAPAAQAASWSTQTTQNGSEAEHSALYDISCEPFTTSACVAVG
jgi:hypothetical protein